jgi:Flp pilus assembly protein TadG
MHQLSWVMAMAIRSILSRCKNRLRRFGAAQDGNAAVIFALAMLPTIGLMGAAIDYSRASAVRSALQSALDSAALMVSKTAPTMTQDEMRAAAERYVGAIYKYNSTYAPTIEVSYNSSSSTVTLNGSATVNSDFMQYVSPRFANMPVNTSSTVTWGMSRLRVALALDNTGSMSASNKMTALQTAAKNLLTQLQSAAKSNGDVYVSIVPFARDVKVGTGYVNATWLNWDVWDVAGHCSKGKWKTKAECVADNETWTPDTPHSSWTGCITDRDQNYDVSNTAPDTTIKATLFLPEQYDVCGSMASMMPLSYSWTALKDKVDAMAPSGNTNITIGLSLAWQTLTAGAPFFPPAEDTNYKYKKVIVLLTDGTNTQNRFTSTQADIDARTSLTCANVKAAGIILYTVLVMEGNQSLLQSCATDTNKYFFLNSADGIVSVFNQIGTDLANLHVSR